MAYIYGNDVFWSAKTDVSDPGGPATEKWMAVDCNSVRTYLLETRSAITAGQGHGFTTQASAPVVTGMSTFIWASTTNSLLKYTFSGSDKNIAFGATTAKGDLLVYTGSAWEVVPVGVNGRVLTANSAQTSGVEWAAAAGTSTLTAAYAAGSSQASSTFNLDSTRLGLLVKDNSTPITGALLSVQNNGGTSKFLDIGATQKQAVKSGMADGGTAIGLEIDTTATWSNSGARLFSAKNNTTERFAVMASGDYNTSASNFWWDLANSRLHIGSPASPTGRLHIRGGNGSQSQMRIDNDTGSVSMMAGSADSPAGAFIGSLSAHPLYLRHTNSNIIAMSATDFSPLGNNTVDFGLTGARWKTGWFGTSIVSPTIGPASGQQHTLPAVTSDTVTLNAAVQTLTNKTIAAYDYQGQSDQVALGAASTTSGTFVDVGNGSSTGFASWTAPSTPFTKTYLLHVTVRCFISVLGTNSTAFFRVVQDGNAIGAHPANINRVASKTAGDYEVCHFVVPVSQTSGVAHVYKLQWMVGTTDTTVNVSPGVGQLQMLLTG